MSFVVHDLKCPQGHEERSVYYRRSEGPTPCPECQEARSVFYAMAETPSAHTVGGEFQPFMFDGRRIESAQEWGRIKAEYARVSGVPVKDLVEVPMGSAREKSARLDDLRHEAHEVRRRQGFDGQTFDRYTKEQRERGAPRVRTGWTR